MNDTPHQTTKEQVFRSTLEEIRNRAFYHMTRHADERGDRRVLGEIKEMALKALAENPQ